MGPELMVAGTALQIVSGWAANMDASFQEAKNAAFYREQANYAAVAALRAKVIAENDYTNKVGTQIGAYASGGVDISGSAAITVGGTVKNALDEMRAIELKGQLDTKLAAMRASASQDKADMYGSLGYNLVQGATTGIGNYAKSEGYGKGFPSFLSSGTPPSAGGAPAKYFPGS